MARLDLDWAKGLVGLNDCTHLVKIYALVQQAELSPILDTVVHCCLVCLRGKGDGVESGVRARESGRRKRQHAAISSAALLRAQDFDRRRAGIIEKPGRDGVGAAQRRTSVAESA